MEKNYDFALWEGHLAKLWAQSKTQESHDKAGQKRTPETCPWGDREDTYRACEGRPYTIIMPPPNVTGSLHLGHALSSAVQDVLIRHKRMQGYDAQWIPGLDHASIATQMMVEKELAAQGITRKSLGREGFLQRVWAWKERQGQCIVEQMKRLGFCANWDRLRFTMDADMCHRVTQAFVALYDQGLIYRAQRLVNWDTALQTAISDLEVVSKEEAGHLWTLRYPSAQGEICPQDSHGKGQESQDIVRDATRDPSALLVSTTRPETLFGDVALAVHPEDERYGHWVGKMVFVPLSQRTIPVIADAAVSREKGTGVVKITPAHDFLDEAIAARHGLSGPSLFDVTGHCIPPMPQDYVGMTWAQAREKVLKDLEDGHFLAHCTDVTHSVPYSDRSGTLVQPYMTHQWFLNVQDMADVALQAVDMGLTRFTPQEWTSTYAHWLKNIQPWCISRQLWWGHRIPVWYGPENSIFVATSHEKACEQARERFGYDVSLEQDPDVLDTWFSSGLWPFTVLNWPQGSVSHQEALEYNGQAPVHLDKEMPVKASGSGSGYDVAVGEGQGAWGSERYPSDILVTGLDIIFFWVARMMMMGLKLTGRVPFRAIYIHPLVQDGQGQKMSKTKNNVVDPLDVVQSHGADALRWTLLHMLTGKSHVRFDKSALDIPKRFMTKIWNMFRFLRGQGLWGPQCPRDYLHPRSWKAPMNQWLAYELTQVVKGADEALGNCAFQEYLLGVQRGLWSVYCDWYLELVKSWKDAAGEAQKENNPSGAWQVGDLDALQETQACLTWAAGVLLRLLQPTMPFMTQVIWELWGHEGEKGRKEICNTKEMERNSDIVCDAASGSALSLAPWPALDFPRNIPVRAMEWMIEAVKVMRRIRWELTLSSENMTVHICHVPEEYLPFCRAYAVTLSKLACVQSISFVADGATPFQDAQAVMSISLDAAWIHIPLEKGADLSAEKARLAKRLEKATQELTSWRASLANEDFLKKAPDHVVQELKNRCVTQEASLNLWHQLLAGL